MVDSMGSSFVITVMAGVSSVIVTTVTYYLTKKKEREADWRKYKFEQYKEFLLSISGIVGSDSTPEGNRVFSKACNTLHLIGSAGVLAAMHSYQNEIRLSNPTRSVEKGDALLSKLIWEVRKDIAIPGTPEEDKFLVLLWCSGTNDDRPH